MWDEVSDFVAKLLTRFPKTSIFASLGLCLLLTAGMHNVHFEQDIRKSFSPDNSQTGIEAHSFLEFHHLKSFPQRAFVIFQSIDGGNVLRKSHIDEIRRLDVEMTSLTSSIDPSDGLRACDPLCDINRPFHILLETLESNSSDESTHVDFPTMKVQDMPLFLGLHLGYGYMEGNGSIAAKSITLWYFNRADTEQRRKDFKDVSMRFFELSINKSFSDHVNMTIFGDQIANHEMVRGAMEATYLMSIGFVFLLVFVIIIVWNQSETRKVPILVAATILTPFISAAAAFGLLAWLGYPVYSMQCVTPFLVLGIGVDDAFILMHRWRARRNLKESSVRLRRVIVDVGPSITITSITNIVAFGVGFFTPTPQMSLFCLSTSIALLLDYIFTYTILAPVVFLCMMEDEYEEVPTVNKKESELLSKYSSLLASFKGRLICFCVLCSLYLFSSYGVLHMKSTFEPAKAFPSDSPLVSALIGIRPVFNTFFPVTIYVNNPPTFSDPQQHKDFLALLSRLEAVPGSYNRNLTQFFLIPYEVFDRKVNSWTSFLGVDQEYHLTLHNLPHWFEGVGRPPSVHLLPNNDTTSEAKLEKFSFSIMGQGMAEWANRALYVHRIREVLNSHPQYNASLFDGDSAVLQLILTVRKDLIGSIAVTVACMAFVCLLFVSSKRGVTIITYVITSICFVLVGCLAWWGADLDPVTQVDVLLATGFSVDYTAHVAYKFYRSGGTAKERIESSLGEMAPPMIQAGMSTFLCMLPLIFVPTYAIVAFAKTIFLVVGIGLIHGLFILPVLLGATVCDNQSISVVETPEKLDRLIEDSANISSS